MDRPIPDDGGGHLWEGVRIVGRDPRLRLLIGSYTADMLLQGVLDVLLVIAAIELLGLGDEGAGRLSTAWGVGGVLAGVVARVLLRRGRIGIGLLAGFVVVGGALVTIGLVPEPTVALGLLVVAGVGFGLVETANLTLTQRLVPPDVLGRVYGVQEVIDVATTALGGVVAAGLVALFGVDGALVAVGLAMPVVALVLRRPVLAMGAGAPVPEGEFALLRDVPRTATVRAATAVTLVAVDREEFLAGIGFSGNSYSTDYDQ